MTMSYSKNLVMRYGKPSEAVRRSQFRTLYNGKAYRLFSFWDKKDNKEIIVIATHGILKKIQKTPPKEIKKAEEIRKQFFARKSKN